MTATRDALMTFMWQITHDYWCDCYRCQLWFADEYMPLLLAKIEEGK